MISLTDILIFFAILIILIYLYLVRNFNYWKIRNVPYNEPIPLFGNYREMVFRKKSPGKYMADLYNQFKDAPYFGFFAIDKPYLILKDPEIIKRVLITDFNTFRDRFFYANKNISPIFANTLFGVRSPDWKELRNKLSPVFTSGKIKMMLPLMKQCGENLEKYIKSRNREMIEAKEMAAKYTTDVITSCAFGIEANSLIDENSEFRAMGRKLFVSTPARRFKALSYSFAHSLVRIFRFTILDEDALNFLGKAFLETIKLREETKVKRQDLIDILIEMKKQDDQFDFDKNKLVAQAITFFTAGHETSSSAISFTLHELCVNSEIQDRLRKEIFETIEKHGDLTYEAIQNMKYLQMIISETLRKYSLAPLIIRECAEDYKIPETGLVIEKGIGIIIPQHGLHWDPKYFPDPQKYDPERFSDENKHNINQYVYLPFGNGPRNCIGERFALLSSKVGIINIVKNFKVEKSPWTVDPLVLKSSGLCQAQGGIPLIFRPL